MKTKLTIVCLVVAFTFAFSPSKAQTEPGVKILPSTQEGIVKVLFAHESEKPVLVSFVGEGGLISYDRIKVNNTQHGFLKKYDITNINSSTFWIEVKSANMEVTYKMKKSKSGSYTPTLEKTIYNHDVVASNN